MRCARSRDNARILRPDYLSSSTRWRPLSLRFFDGVTRHSRLRASAHLALENGRRSGRDDFVTFQDELGIDCVACRFVNFVATEIALEFVFVIIVAAETKALAIGCEFLLLI